MSIKDYKFSFDRRKIGLLASLFILLLSLGQLAWTLRADNVVPKVQVDMKKSLRVMSWNWFGNVKEVPTINTNYEDQPLQEIDINADLLGVMLSENNSSATLKFQGRPEKVFKIGDKLSGSIELVEIQAYRIIVQDKGIRKQLLMKKHDVIMESSRSEGANESKIRQEGFAIANLFGAVPVKVNEDQGFKVSNLSSEVKALADIRDGDVVLEVNGSSVQNLMSNPMNLIFTDLNSDNKKIEKTKFSDEPICIIIGPEGDFSEHERQEILSFKGVQALKINDNILRSETAVISAISIINYVIN